MVIGLDPAPLAAARPPLSRLVVRAWILLGRQRLDGLVCVKSWAGERWPEQFQPWLEQAEDLRETDEYIFLRFVTPLEIDCNLLGGLLPLCRQGGILSSAAVEASDELVVGGLEDAMVLVLHGQLRAVPLSSFRQIDIGALWDISNFVPVESIAVPLLMPGGQTSQSLKTQSIIAFDATDVTAGFSDLHERLEQAAASNTQQRAKWHRQTADATTRRLAKRIALPACGAIILTVLLLLARTLIAPDVSPPLLSTKATQHTAAPPVDSALWIHLSAWLVGLVLLFALSIARGRIRSDQGVHSARAAAQGKSIRQVWKGRAGRQSQRQRGSSASPQEIMKPIERSANQDGTKTSRPRSRMGRLAAWLIWNTPLRKDLQKKFDERLHEVERLFGEGRVDEALKKALSLADENDNQSSRKTLDAYGDLPLQGPSVREKIELDFSGTRDVSRGALSPQAYAHFRSLYQAQAKRLAATGDYESAVFIYAELLNDPRGAVDLLIKADRLETAARLAQARRLPPGFFIPLWFRAGDKQRALALAARHEAFQELWKELKPGDPFRAVLAAAWARRLVASGNYRRALAITDGLADDVGLERMEWIRIANQDSLDGEMLARALKSTPWEMDEKSGPYAAFNALLANGHVTADERIVLARALADMEFERGAATEFAARLPLLAHQLVRRLIVDEAELGHDKERALCAASLSEQGKQFALRVDLRRLAKIPKPATIVPVTCLKRPSTPALASIVDAVVVPGGRVLIGYRSGLVKLLTFGGKEIWRRQVNGLEEFVPIGDGYAVFFVRHDFGERSLSVLETGPLAYRDLGSFPVQYHHPWATEDGWLVYSGREVLMIDVPTLLGQAREFEDGELVRHWAVAMSEPGRPLFFIDRPDEVNWAFERFDGLVEWWSITKSTLQIVCKFWINPPEQEDRSEIVSTAFGYGSTRVGAIFRVQLSGVECPITCEQATREIELKLLALGGKRQALMMMAPTASQNSLRWTVSRRATGLEWTAWSPGGGSRFSIELEGADRMWSHPHRTEPVTTIFDNLGHMMVVDVGNGHLLMELM